MSKPDNTAADHDLNLIGISIIGADLYITGQEAVGQRQLVESTSLPTDTAGHDADYLALGFTFGEPDPSDPLFRPATLPDGWSKQPSDHSMWSYVVDEHGRRRVAVFYKAAFYDRSAHMRLETVYGYAHTLRYDKALPVYDETWCTRETFATVVGTLLTELVEQVRRAQAWVADDPRSTYWPERLGELRNELNAHHAWAARIAGAR